MTSKVTKEKTKNDDVGSVEKMTSKLESNEQRWCRNQRKTTTSKETKNRRHWKRRTNDGVESVKKQRLKSGDKTSTSKVTKETTTSKRWKNCDVENDEKTTFVASTAFFRRLEVIVFSSNSTFDVVFFYLDVISFIAFDVVAFLSLLEGV